MLIKNKIKKNLKSPLGILYSNPKRLISRVINKKVISVGDMTTLVLLSFGITPHLAVFDGKWMRKKVPSQITELFKLHFPVQKEIKNPKGELSNYLLKNSKRLIQKGGALFIDGEEDLTALAFILDMADENVLVYGQPKEGIVLIRNNKKLKEKLRNLLFSDK